MKFYQIIHDDLSELRGQVVSIIGGGGKSSLLLRIGEELVKENLKVILTSTTKLQAFPEMGLVLTGENQNFVSQLKLMLDKIKIALVAQEYYKAETLKGLHKLAVQQLTKYADIVLVEADGCRQRPLKTHRDYEPPIPPTTNTVIIISGANAVGERLTEKTVHRTELFAQKWNLPDGTLLTPEIISQELLSPHSYLRNIPIQARVRFLINKSDTNSIGGKLLAEHLMRKCSYPVFLGSVTNHELKRISIEHS